MKIKKIETRITYFIITIGLFLLNIKNLTLLSIIISNILSLLFIFLFEKLNLSKFKLTKFLIMIISFIYLIFNLNNITIFIGDNILREYSIVVISLTLLFLIFYLANKGYHTLIKVILLATYFIIFLIIISFLITIPYIDLSNLTINIFKTNNLFKETILYTFSLIYPYLLIYPLSNTKFKVSDFLVTMIFQILFYLLIISILGLTLESIYKYPYITIFKKVSLFGFIERIEIIPSLNYLFCFYFLLVLSYYQVLNYLSLYIKKDKNLNIIKIFIFLLIFLVSLAIQ